MNIHLALQTLGINPVANMAASTGQKNSPGRAAEIKSTSPVDGNFIGSTGTVSVEDYEFVVKQAQVGFSEWRTWPAPRRGEVVRQLGMKLRGHKEALGALVSYEMGKSLQEGLGEVQEMIDICDFAVGLSRQLYGLTIASERPSHRMMEQWQPLGPVGIITAFNFPVAVWAWNTVIAWVCGDTTIWKPSEKTPLCGIACQNLAIQVFAEMGVPEGVSCLVQGGREVGEWMSNDSRLPLISATGSVRMGKEVAKTVAARLGKTLLELGGNNALIVSQHANLDLAIRAVVFGAVGTAGQRCTSTRRVIVHEHVFDSFKNRLIKAYGQIKIGDPLNPENHMGPLIDKDAVTSYLKAIEIAKSEGGIPIVEGGVLSGEDFQSGCYVKPCIIEVEGDFKCTQTETFAPLLYIMKYSTLDQAIEIQNGVPQGLSSALFTQQLQEAEQFLSFAGSDCGIANVNLGTSGAEIGGAFGGEKETGGGRESGSDAWKAYMRRQTNTVNYGTSMPLAQGIRFDF
ncbi:MAG: aldehyde dehydrogenase family protein [Bacteroidetes bacterium]|nr:aldehyde dehydrogenase family protein [Bacteroidota bacterium]